jgi:hypothetical protein
MSSERLLTRPGGKAIRAPLVRHGPRTLKKPGRRVLSKGGLGSARQAEMHIKWPMSQ